MKRCMQSEEIDRDSLFDQTLVRSPLILILRLLGKDPDAGKYWRQQEKRIKWLDNITDFMSCCVQLLSHVQLFLTPWAWIWANPGRQWKIEGPCVLQSMRSQKVRYDLVTEWDQQPTLSLLSLVLVKNLLGQCIENTPPLVSDHLAHLYQESFYLW